MSICRAARVLSVLAVLAGLVAFASPARALGIRLLDPAPAALATGVEWASRVVRHEPVAPHGDTNPGLGGAPALFAPDDIGFFPEPDSNLSVALGSGGAIELAFAHSVVSDGVLVTDSSSAGAEILIFEDGELDGARFFGRRRADLSLVFLASVAEAAVLDPVAPGLGPGGRDTAIALDLDRLLPMPADLVSLYIVDDAITMGSQTFEVDAAANLSPGARTPASLPEPGPVVLLTAGLVALGRSSARPGPSPGSR